MKTADAMTLRVQHYVEKRHTFISINGSALWFDLKVNFILTQQL